LPNDVPSSGGLNCEHRRHQDDQPDELTGDQVHVVYLLSSDADDEQLDTNGTLNRSVTAANRWLADRTGRRLRFDTCGGHLDVSFLRLDRTNADLESQTNDALPQTLETELASRGMLTPHKLVLAFYGGPYDQCGQADHPPDLPGQLAVVFPHGGDFIKVCGSPAACLDTPGKIEADLVHELFHALGAVAPCAPHYDVTRPGHVTDRGDLMDGFRLADVSDIVDIGNDDYFNTGRTDCVDVARSTFLSPTVEGAVEPPGWSTGLPGTLMPADAGLSAGCHTDNDCPPPVPHCCASSKCAVSCP
jgi:hypothetical protein